VGGQPSTCCRCRSAVHGDDDDVAYFCPTSGSGSRSTKERSRSASGVLRRLARTVVAARRGAGVTRSRCTAQRADRERTARWGVSLVRYKLLRGSETYWGTRLLLSVRCPLRLLEYCLGHLGYIYTAHGRNCFWTVAECTEIRRRRLRRRPSTIPRKRFRCYGFVWNRKFHRKVPFQLRSTSLGTERTNIHRGISFRRRRRVGCRTTDLNSLGEREGARESPYGVVDHLARRPTVRGVFCRRRHRRVT
jgi:hypothetical protein